MISSGVRKLATDQLENQKTARIIFEPFQRLLGHSDGFIEVLLEFRHNGQVRANGCCFQNWETDVPGSRLDLLEFSLCGIPVALTFRLEMNSSPNSVAEDRDIVFH